MANPLTVNTTGFDNGIRPLRGGDYIEDQIGTFLANEALLSGDLVRIRSDNKIELADSNAPGKADVRGFVFKPVAINGGASVHRRGALSGYNGIVTPGAPLYLSATPGKIATADPANTAQQTILINGSPTDGTFTLSYGGQTTTALDEDANAATVQAALEALSTIGVGNVIVSGGVASTNTAYVVSFVNDFVGRAVTPITADISLLTGGTPAVTITQTTPSALRVPVGFGYKKDGFDVVFLDIPILF